MIGFRLCSLIVMALCFSVALASAQPEGENLEELRRRALVAYEAGDYVAAAQAFEELYERSRNPAYLFSWAQAERKQGNCEAAIRVYQRFLATSPAEADVVATQGHISQCQRAIAVTSKVVPEKSPDVARTPPTEKMPAAEPKLILHASSKEQDAAWYTDGWAGAATASGLVATGVGLWLVSRQRDLSRSQESAESVFEFEQIGSREVRYRRGASIALATGGGLLTIGLIRYAWKARARRLDRSDGVQAHFAILPDGLGAAIRGDF